MALLIDAEGSLIKEDPWHRSEGEAKQDYSLLTSDYWSGLSKEQKARQLAISPHLGLELKAEEPLSQLGSQLGSELEDEVDCLGQIALLVVVFPLFRDGRGYSLIRRCRQELGFRGDIRAAGDILADQLYFLKRCGATSFVIADDDLDEVKQLIFPFSHAYQGAADKQETITKQRSKS